MLVYLAGLDGWFSAVRYSVMLLRLPAAYITLLKLAENRRRVRDEKPYLEHTDHSQAIMAVDEKNHGLMALWRYLTSVRAVRCKFSIRSFCDRHDRAYLLYTGFSHASTRVDERNK